MKLAITAASGHLGRRTLDAVLQRGVAPEDVVAAVRTTAKLAEYAERGVQVRQADYDDPDSLRSAFTGVERVLLVPSPAAPGPRCLQYERAIAAAQKTGVKHLLHYGLVPTSLMAPFAITPFLLFAESALRTSGLEFTILRNSIYSDLIADGVPGIVKRGTIPYPTGDARCAYVSRDDLARAGAAALTTDGHEGRIYHLTGPRGLTTADLCRIVAETAGKPVEDRNATDEDYLAACKADGTPDEHACRLLTLYWTIRDGFLDVATTDIEQLTGTRAETFEEYLRRRLA